LTTEQGIPIDDKQNVITAGPRGAMLMQDVIYMDEMAHFDRERIPERVVHAKGAGKDQDNIIIASFIFKYLVFGHFTKIKTL